MQLHRILLRLIELAPSPITHISHMIWLPLSSVNKSGGKHYAIILQQGAIFHTSPSKNLQVSRTKKNTNVCYQVKTGYLLFLHCGECCLDSPPKNMIAVSGWTPDLVLAWEGRGQTHKLNFLDSVDDSRSSSLLLSLLTRKPGYDRASVPQERENQVHCSWDHAPGRIWGRLWHLWCLVLQWQGISVCLILWVKYKINRWECNLRFGVTKFYEGCKNF